MKSTELCCITAFLQFLLYQHFGFKTLTKKAISILNKMLKRKKILACNWKNPASKLCR